MRQNIKARYKDEAICLSQNLMAKLFSVKVHTINEHLKNIFEQGEISPEATIRKFRIVQNEGSREVARNIDFDNLDILTLNMTKNTKCAFNVQSSGKKTGS